jgi:hypothetical protein
MNSLEFEVISVAKNGAAHVKINSDLDNLGVLYLDKHQFEPIRRIFARGCFENNIDFNIKNPFEVDEFEEENILDIDYSEN